MLKKIAAAIFAGFMLFNLYGCFLLLAGAAGGTGTAAWLSGKLAQQVNAPFDTTIKASKSALKSLRLEVTKETKEEAVAQIMSKYNDGRTIWIDVHKITDNTSKIEVRVGAVGSNKEAASKIMKRITQYL